MLGHIVSSYSGFFLLDLHVDPIISSCGNLHVIYLQINYVYYRTNSAADDGQT